MLNTKIVMNMELLNLIKLVQDFKNYKLSEHFLFGNVNFDQLTREYFNSLPNELLNKFNLSKNNISYDKVICYPLTDEMLATESHELSKFEF